jgi:hypothetical protein
MTRCPSLLTCLLLSSRPCKRVLARLRLCKATTQTNLQLGVRYTQRLCTRGCLSAIDSKHHLLFECLATEDLRAAFTDVLPLADADLGSLMDMVYQQDAIDNILEFAYRKLSRANSLIGCVVLCNNNNNAGQLSKLYCSTLLVLAATRRPGQP